MEEEPGASTAQPPEIVRDLQTPAALALADLSAIFENSTKVVGCCEQIYSALRQDSAGANQLLIESLWVTALISYQRCFSPGKRGVGLTEQDLGETGLQGDLVEWHRTLTKLYDYYADTDLNDRESFVVGAAQDADGSVSGIAITSTPEPQPDETTIRQTGQLALELSRLVDERIKDQQKAAYDSARAMGPAGLSELSVVYISNPAEAGDLPSESTSGEKL